LARVRRVGPDLPSGVRRPDRSVSLQDVDQLPVETMGLADVGWSSTVAKPGAWSSDAESWEELLDSKPGGTMVQAGMFDVFIIRGDGSEYGDIRRFYHEELDPRLNPSPAGSVQMDFEVHKDAVAAEMTPGQVRESLRLVGGIAESIRDEGLNVVAQPASPQHARLYRQFGMRPAYGTEEERSIMGETGLEPLVLPGRHEPGEQTSERVGLSDEDRRPIEQPGGFMPSPPVPNIIPGPPSQPPQLPDVGGFTPSPPVSGLLPGAPIRGPQKPTIEGMPIRPQGPTVLSMEGQQRLPGMEPPPPDWRLTPEQIATGKEWLPKVRDTLEGTRPPADDLNPQSQMSQTMLADLFARRAAEQQNQSQQGYFGGLGRAVGGMSTEQKIALALALTLLTGGGASPAVGSALGVGAGLAAAG
jgi:hypothetical protein